jgi:hypothetical protein
MGSLTFCITNVGGFDGSKARDVLINEEQLQELGIE